ncbi:HlyD family efflux transporter periplasmic adaptor subunit [Chitinophaga rhizosphaerae]|uniref:HlyD family efflux transporter periplasmic adaptor subunit n=1 Tax=Chitinophaga rhizosphaerae TaxID=1864947 RepID=UPI000F80E05F|nr:HlyD family efflux transporter periplasmic adaptor subunit [Chitinophaga rhizosphaerae]
MEDNPTIQRQAGNGIFPERAHSEEVQDIIDRMPARFGTWACGIVLLIFLFLLLFGYIIRYPDVVKGQITINGNIPPVKLVAASSGKLRLHQSVSGAPVTGGMVIAGIDNTTSFASLQQIKQLLSGYQPGKTANLALAGKLPARAPLGELSSSYYAFLENLNQCNDFARNGLYDRQIASLGQLLEEQKKEIVNSTTRTGLSEKNVSTAYKLFHRDSVLFTQGAASEETLDRSLIEHLNSRNQYTSAISQQIASGKDAQQTESRIVEVEIEKKEKEKLFDLALLASFNDLQDRIRSWEQKYLFVAPFDGRLQFLRFWSEHQFVQAGEAVFTIVPEQQDPYGQVRLPAFGAGKIRTGQEVIVKLDDFPYNEYGSVKAIVHSISLTTNIEKTPQGDIETYLVTLQFPEGLQTNFGTRLNVKQETKGIAEIITNDRKLIERLFDNLKYIVDK